MQTLLACCAVVASLSFAVSAGCAVDLLLARRQARREAVRLQQRVAAERAASRELTRRAETEAVRSRPTPVGSPYRLDPAPRT